MLKIKILSIAIFIISLAWDLSAQVFNRLPDRWEWLDNKEVAFIYEGSDDSLSFAVNAFYRTKRPYARPEKVEAIVPEGAENVTLSPDSSKIAYTKANDLYVTDLTTGEEKRLTSDGSDVILNGYASWIYYEEIFGRPSKYKAFWWSPDSKKIAFYRFDNTKVPVFPIYSPFGNGGSLRKTRYPKAGDPNPEVRIGFVELESGNIVWADFNASDDQYFGTPFWGADSKALFVCREPRLQNALDLYSVEVTYGSKRRIYHEEYKTWLDWIDGMLFTSKGLYMVRSFESLWQQIYFLSYDGKYFKRITDGDNWRMSLIAANEKTGEVFFTAERGQHVRRGLYKVDSKKKITQLTDTSLDVSKAEISPDFKYFAVQMSNYTTPSQVWVVPADKLSKKSFMVADMKGKDYREGDFALPSLIFMTTTDGFELPAAITYPKNFDPLEKYPVHMDIYGGPDTPLVRDRWTTPDDRNQWWSENGIIEIVADCRAAGHNGRAGMDMIYKRLGELEVKDFVEWANYLKGLPYVIPDKIGVEGFSFGGTITSLLVMNHPDSFHYGVAGGGVYDWALYDSHYTERFMDTPDANPEGYKAAMALRSAKNYPVKATGLYDGEQSPCSKKVDPVMLKLTHGTGDDNVHFQHTLMMVNALQRCGGKFELMIYPDAMHGYHGYQREHFLNSNKEFWLKYLKEK